jgi:hypothetical protein
MRPAHDPDQPGRPLGRRSGWLFIFHHYERTRTRPPQCGFRQSETDRLRRLTASIIRSRRYPAQLYLIPIGPQSHSNRRFWRVGV